jgi:hypothetical protein
MPKNGSARRSSEEAGQSGPANSSHGPGLLLGCLGMSCKCQRPSMKPATHTHTQTMPALFKRQKAIGVTIRGEVHATLPSPDCQQERNVGPFLPLVSVGHTNGITESGHATAFVSVDSGAARASDTVCAPSADCSTFDRLAQRCCAVVMLLQIRAMYMALSQTRSLSERPLKG